MQPRAEAVQHRACYHSSHGAAFDSASPLPDSQAPGDGLVSAGSELGQKPDEHARPGGLVTDVDQVLGLHKISMPASW